MSLRSHLSSYFPFTDTAPSEIYTLSLHDALPISGRRLDAISCAQGPLQPPLPRVQAVGPRPDPVAEHARLHLARRGVVAYAEELDGAGAGIEDRELGELVALLARGVDGAGIDEIGPLAPEGELLLKGNLLNPHLIGHLAVHLVDLLLVAVAEEAKACAGEVLAQQRRVVRDERRADHVLLHVAHAAVHQRHGAVLEHQARGQAGEPGARLALQR